MQRHGDVTYEPAQIRENDFFEEVDRTAGGDTSHAAKRRFAHAGIVMPFDSKMGLKNFMQQVAWSTPATTPSARPAPAT